MFSETMEASVLISSELVPIRLTKDDKVCDRHHEMTVESVEAYNPMLMREPGNQMVHKYPMIESSLRSRL